jgi:hypothetical protein
MARSCAMLLLRRRERTMAHHPLRHAMRHGTGGMAHLILGPIRQHGIIETAILKLCPLSRGLCCCSLTTKIMKDARRLSRICLDRSIKRQFEYTIAEQIRLHIDRAARRFGSRI